MLNIYNTLSRRKEEFKPIHSGKISMYVCGITVYDLCHIGHGRTFVAFDVISRYLRYIGYKLNYVRNITDVDDKIIMKAYENRETVKQLTNRMIHKMHQDFEKLYILPPDNEPRVSDHIIDIIELIQKLINTNNAYISDNGDVMFDVSSNNNYGILSRQDLNQLKDGIRIKTTSHKHHPKDFVLWKISKKNELSWYSPWGNGRPGWHIECSAMNYKNFGSHLDIHGGGADLIFPHHENEIAQSTCAHNGPYVNYWMHSGMVAINHEKMSKSLKNFFTVYDVLQRYDSETIRYFLISSHYRKQLNYTENNLKQASIALEKLYIALRYTDINMESNIGEEFEFRFCMAMDDDFNTPVAISVMFDIVHEINRFKKNKNNLFVNYLASKLSKLGKILGILQQNPDDFLQKKIKYNDDKIIEIEYLVQLRDDMRAAKKWKEADRIRDKINELKVIVEDGLQKTTWRHK